MQSAHFFFSTETVKAVHFSCTSKSGLSNTTKVGLFGDAYVSVVMMEAIDVDLQVF